MFTHLNFGNKVDCILYGMNELTVVYSLQLKIRYICFVYCCILYIVLLLCILYIILYIVLFCAYYSSFLFTYFNRYSMTVKVAYMKLLEQSVKLVFVLHEAAWTFHLINLCVAYMKLLENSVKLVCCLHEAAWTINLTCVWLTWGCLNIPLNLCVAYMKLHEHSVKLVFFINKNYKKHMDSNTNILKGSHRQNNYF